MVVLSASLVTGSITPALARGGRGGGGGGQMRGGGGGQMHGSGARSAPQARPATTHNAAPATHSGRTGNVNRGNVNAGNRNVNVNNRQANVRVDRSRDVNVQRNTVVRPAPRGYGRAPYAYGGRRYYAHNRYGYHRYRPYASWGVGFHPFGAFVATVAATAVIVSVANTQYRYSQGVWYAPASGGYTVVTAPVGATVAALPPQATVVNNNNYYYGGAYYEKTGGEYKVVPPQAGTVVDQLPPGGEEVTIGEQKYVKFGDTYYQPFEENGKPKYEVVEVK
jgi:hypothetical protein